MEIFERAGIASAFAAAANRIDGIRLVTPRRSVLVTFDHLRTEFKYVSILPQWRTQTILEQRVRELDGEVRYGCTLTALQQQSDGVVATIETPGRQRIVQARYAIGCDGVYSAVRNFAGIAFPGVAYPGTALLADVPVTTKLPANEARVHVYDGGVLTMFPMDARLRRIVAISPGESLPECADAQWLQDRLERAGYEDCIVEPPLWSNAFRVHRRVATAMRAGNVLLAGDSAHTHSPVGGQGMNIGLHDAYSLAAKLARVLHGDAPETLLDTYEHERLPVARSVVRRTDMLTRALLHPHPALRLARETLAPALVRMPVVYRPVIRALSLTA
jgi:2-polyprenyl-6-methoxyphenol hydroxylase-like FAD-dependent oxidoreductase